MTRVFLNQERRLLNLKYTLFHGVRHGQKSGRANTDIVSI